MKPLHNQHFLHFLRTGDENSFNSIPKLDDGGGRILIDLLPSPDDWTDEAERLVRVAVAHGQKNMISYWMGHFCRWSFSDHNHFNAMVRILRQAGVDETWVHECLGHAKLTRESSGRYEATQAGEMLLELDPQIAVGLVQEKAEYATLLAFKGPERLKGLLATLWKVDGHLLHWDDILKANPDLHDLGHVFFVGNNGRALAHIAALIEIRPDLYQDWGWKKLHELLRYNPNSEILSTMLVCKAPDSIDLIERWLGSARSGSMYSRQFLLDQYKKAHPERIVFVAEAMTRSGLSSVVLRGLKEWRELGVSSKDFPQFRAGLLSVFGDSDSFEVLNGIKEAVESDLLAMAPDLWPLMQHKSRPVRTAAARALAGLGFAEASPNGIKLLQSKKADVRLSAVTLFQRLGGAESMQVLKERLETEEADAVRDAILLTLDAAGALSLSAADFAAGVQRTLAKAKGCPVDWLEPAKLNLARKDGSKLSADEVLYLLIRQSRCNEMRADIEARPLYATLDRKACAAPALEVLEAFLASKQESGDRWTIAIAALTGDDRLVPPLHRAVIHWTDNARGKLAEYAVGALALIGTDAALMLLDSLSVRFRSKNKNIGEAAAEAFMAAAESRGVTVEELGDMVVPWLGFEPGLKKTISAGANNWEVWIGPDFKLVYKDTKTGKKLGKLPASIGSAIAEEQKMLSANLKEAVKAQLLRMETLLVRQFHWPVARWRELYLQHPLLRPFSEQLIWRYHPTDSNPSLTFRSLGDGGLTNAEGDAFELPNEGTVSLLHPLDLAEAEKDAWLTHMEDYEMLPPFPQLLRPVHICRAEDQSIKVVSTVSGTELNAMTFRGRSEKLGWVRSSVCDGGGVGAYRKVFSGTGVDAFLQLEGMYVGITMHDSITLGDVYFVTSGSVKVGSYTYDEPSDGNDPRVIALGQVPPVAYSEVMADLFKISGKTVEES